MSLPNTCPLCFSLSENQNVVTKHVFGSKTEDRSFFRCKSCEVIYQYPLLTPDEEKRFYISEFESFMDSRSGNVGGWLNAEKHIKANEETVKRRMNYLLPHFLESKSVLDVGCSSGFMLFPLREDGHMCYGIEPSGVFSEYVKSRGIQVFDFIEDVSKTSIKFDIIMHFFVLEHISDPLTFLKQQLSLLKPGGKIIFEIPNSADPLYSIYDIPAFERFYWSIAHPWYFNESSLKYLLDKLGYKYEIKFDQRYDLSNHMTWARDGKPGGMKKYTHLLGEDFEEEYKKNLIEKKLCDTLIGIITA
jgi:2-polyprenyl-3-methyl-5-hydroxy-6-metoxy-1,4-benzoquinol methylase